MQGDTPNSDRTEHETGGQFANRGRRRHSTYPCRECDGRAERVAVGHGGNRFECPDCGARYIVTAQGRRAFGGGGVGV